MRYTVFKRKSSQEHRQAPEHLADGYPRAGRPGKYAYGK